MTETNADGYIFIHHLPKKIIYKQNTKEMDLTGLELAKVVNWNPAAISRIPEEKIFVKEFRTDKIGPKKVMIHVENTVLPIEIIIIPE